uniref:FYVE, RhoGEF and PH domain containing 6 n=1 Tax=Callorhinchus milii TaxID=7868 RepID=A0A4W3J1F7_CALMI
MYFLLEIKKPPVAPKPKLMVGNKPGPPPVAPKPDVLSIPLQAHKGPKPALAPKPTFSKPLVVDVNPTPPQNNIQSSEEIHVELTENVKCPKCQNGGGKEGCKSRCNYIMSPCTCKAECGQKYINGKNTCKTQLVVDQLAKLEGLENGKLCDQTHSSRTRHRPDIQCGKMVNKYQVIRKAGFPEQKFKEVLTQVVSPNNCLPKQKETDCDTGAKLHDSNNRKNELFNADQTLLDTKSSNGVKSEMLCDRVKDLEAENVAHKTKWAAMNEKSSHGYSTDHKEKGHYNPHKVNFIIAEQEKLIFQDSHHLTTVKQSDSAPCTKPVPKPKPKKARLLGIIRQNCIEDPMEFNSSSSESCLKTTGNMADFRKPFVSIDSNDVSYSKNNYENSHQTVEGQSESSENITELSRQVKELVSLKVPHNQSGLTLTKPALVSVSKVDLSSDIENKSKIEQIKRNLESGNRTLPAEKISSFVRSSLSMSLPKCVSLSYVQNVPLASSVEGSDFKGKSTNKEMYTRADGSPKAIPKKPQRHSLPAVALIKRDLSAETVKGESCSVEHDSEEGSFSSTDSKISSDEHKIIRLTEKPIWRLPHPILPCSGSPGIVATESTTQQKERSTALKPRAKSFTSADIERPEQSPKESPKKNSFKKILGIKLPARMRTDLQKFLSKGSYSIDTAPSVLPSVETHQDSNHCRPRSQTDGRKNKPLKVYSANSCHQTAQKGPMLRNLSQVQNNSSIRQESTTELQKECPPNSNEQLTELQVLLSPKYENICTNFDWKDSSSNADCDPNLYEVEPYAVSICYQKYSSDQRNQSISNMQDQDNHSSEVDVNSDEEEIIFSSDEEDASSDTSKGELDQHDDKQKDQETDLNIQNNFTSTMFNFDGFQQDFRDAVTQATRQYGKQVIEDKILNQILYYLPQLYELNRGLLRELEERMAHWNEHRRIADIFMTKGPYLKMYSTYIKEFDKNVCLLDEQCKKNPIFAAVVKEFEMSSRCASLALKHYLLKPVQRIPQYKLLLTDYVKNLSKDCVDYKDTQAALAIVVEVANHANDIMKQGDNFQKLMQIQYSLNGQHEIVQPGRVFLKEGTLMKLSRKIMQPRMFFLLNDVLLYTTPVQSGMYKLNNMLSLAGMKVSKPSQEAYQNELNIESVERSFILSASSATERDEWLEAISKAIEDYTKKRITFSGSKSLDEEEADKTELDSPLGTKAPIWIPDPRATMCMICTCDFTLTWRRHHCRACGKIVCQACSSNKFSLDYLKNRPARVCDYCFTELQKRETQSDVKMLSTPQKSSSALTSVLHSIQHSSGRKHKKIPAALKEVSANTGASSMSGYLYRSKGSKKPWKRFWFVIQNKVLYTYAASEDVAALESQPLLGFTVSGVHEDPTESKVIFQLLHKRTLFYVFKVDDQHTAQRWIEVFQEATVL